MLNNLHALFSPSGSGRWRWIRPTVEKRCTSNEELSACLLWKSVVDGCCASLGALLHGNASSANAIYQRRNGAGALRWFINIRNRSRSVFGGGSRGPLCWETCLYISFYSDHVENVNIV